jgi:hypothetical protein
VRPRAVGMTYFFYNRSFPGASLLFSTMRQTLIKEAERLRNQDIGSFSRGGHEGEGEEVFGCRLLVNVVFEKEGWRRKEREKRKEDE